MTTQQAKTRWTTPTWADDRLNGALRARDGALISTVLASLDLAEAHRIAQSGILVTGAAGNGKWQYSLDGLLWTDFGKVSRNASLLFDAACRVRFVADTAQSGVGARLALEAWEPARPASAAQPLRLHLRGRRRIAYRPSPAGRAVFCMRSSGSIISIGSGKTIVDDLSPAIEVSVCR